jgi:ATP-binding cassette subfamily F protein uup
MKLKWKEAKELESIENDIMHAESEVVRIEAIFASPDFYEKRGEQTVQLTEDLAAAKACIERLYVRWHELEEIRSGKN